ncbi:Rhodanese-like domain-containing protein 4 [Forsythia ovata]|uniref:Rhodanese-like domain-containing protein 4 n=1 Tax=Forsythia ovata TaxID=205694 RepID=A0ABD1PY97_9LAMI
MADCWINPLSVLAKRNEPRKSSSLASIPPFKNQNLSILSNNNSDGVSLSRNLQGGLVFLSSFLNSGLAKALSYEEALQQAVSSSSSAIDFDVLDGVINFVKENPVIVGGGALILTVPLVVAQLLSKSKPWGVESAKNAYAKLADDSNAQLLDIRASGELRQVGSPDIRGLKKKPVAVVYKGEDKPGPRLVFD